MAGITPRGTPVGAKGKPFSKLLTEAVEYGEQWLAEEALLKAIPKPDSLPALSPRASQIARYYGKAVKAEPEAILSDREQEVDDLIRKAGPLTGKEISNETGIGAKVLSNHVIPALKKKRGLQNKRSRGYFYPT